MENGKSKREDVCPGKKLDRAAVQRQLEQTKGPEYWRSLEELAGSPEFQEMLHREFPKGASEWLDSVSRRGFLKLMGASLAMAGMTACTKQPLEPIVPYVRQPEEVIPDRSQTITYLGDVRTWGDFLNAIHGPLIAQKAVQGAGIRILTQTVSSPTLADQLRSLLKIYPQAKWHVYEPINRDNVLEGAKLAFGQPVETQYKLENADV